MQQLDCIISSQLSLAVEPVRGENGHRFDMVVNTVYYNLKTIKRGGWCTAM